MLALAWRSLHGEDVEPSTLRNPLQLRNAVEMALLFQFVLYAVHYMRDWIGDGA